jgi:integrase
VERGNSEVDPRVVLNPKQARQVLAALTYAGTTTGQYDYLYAFFATMYYGAMRPAEVNRLREEDCKLPDPGWGELLLEKSASRVNARYTDSGETWEVRNLKRRAEGSIRRVPIPPPGTAHRSAKTRTTCDMRPSQPGSRHVFPRLRSRNGRATRSTSC